MLDGMTQLAIMRRDVLGVAPEDTLGFAAEQMADAGRRRGVVSTTGA